MIEKTKTINATSELRQNIITGEWVIIATGRGKRPDDFLQENRKIDDAKTDPFADPTASDQHNDTLIYRDDDGEWTTRVFPNKYPALTPVDEVAVLEDGPHVGVGGYGVHELVVTRDPHNHFARLDVPAIAEVIDAYQDRYLTHMRSRAIRYVSIFHNHGPKSGASVSHPHSQILALPVVPIVVQAELDAVNRFYKKNHINPFRVMLEHELSVRSRLVAENDDFVVLCPFAPRMAMEMYIMSKDPQPYFERITDAKKIALAEVLQAALRALDRGLNNPDYNLFLHTAPCDGWDHVQYMWYIDIMPRTAKIAGFELATSMEIVTVAPEDATQFLRAQL